MSALDLRLSFAAARAAAAMVSRLPGWASGLPAPDACPDGSARDCCPDVSLRVKAGSICPE